MKRAAVFTGFIFFVLTVFSQTDPPLKQRLKLFMDANQAQNFEKVLDDTYPKLLSKELLEKLDAYR
jgi:hypothetical protein